LILSEKELKSLAYEFTGGALKDLSLDQLYRLITVSQHVTDPEACRPFVDLGHDRGRKRLQKYTPIPFAGYR